MDFFVIIFYLNATMLLIIATVTIHTCVSLHEVRYENNLHHVGMFTQVSGFGVCMFVI